MKAFLLLSFVFTLPSSFASTATDHLSFLFYKNKIEVYEKSFENDGQCNPLPESSSCVKVVCSHLPSYLCDSPEEIKEVTIMCKGNFGGACVEGVTKQIPSYQSDTLEEMREIATGCRGVYGNQCLSFVVSKLPSYQLDSKEEVLEVLSQCKSTSYEVVDCAKFTCDKLPSYKCDSRDELIEILKSCGN